MSNFSFLITPNKNSVNPEHTLTVYEQSNCVSRCNRCPFVDRCSTLKNRLGIDQSIMTYMVSHIPGTSTKSCRRLSDIVYSGACIKMNQYGERIQRIRNAVSIGTKFHIELCGASTKITNFTRCVDSSFDVVLLGSPNWYAEEYQSTFGYPDETRKSMTITWAENIVANLTEVKQRRDKGKNDKIITYIHPEMTLDELHDMAIRYNLYGAKYWELRPFVDSSNPKEPVLYKYANWHEIVQATGSISIAPHIMEYCIKETKHITLKGNVGCVTIANVQESQSNPPQSSSSATTGPCLSSNEEVSTLADGISDAQSTL